MIEITKKHPTLSYMIIVLIIIMPETSSPSVSKRKFLKLSNDFSTILLIRFPFPT